MAVVAIPVKDEAARIAACLRALAGQRGGAPGAVVLLLNNCADGTAAVVAGLAPALPFRVHVECRELAPARASAGHARRLAMACAAALPDAEGVLLTTDADGRVAPDWLAENRRALAAGADIVCGRAIIDPVEARAIPAALHADDEVECAYGALLDRIHALVDPDPNDPWPRHTEHSGASLALRARAFARVGGVPDVPMGEDRALVAALRRIDGAVRHAPAVRVVVSGRTEGRARGGMADTMRRRITSQDPHLDESLEPARDCLRRAIARALLHAVWAAGDTAAASRLAWMGIASVARLRALAGGRHFGEAWDALEGSSPVLGRRLVSRALVAAEHGVAHGIVRRLLAGDARRVRPVLARAVADGAPAELAACGETAEESRVGA